MIQDPIWAISKPRNVRKQGSRRQIHTIGPVRVTLVGRSFLDTVHNNTYTTTVFLPTQLQLQLHHLCALCFAPIQFRGVWCLIIYPQALQYQKKTVAIHFV